MGRRLEAINSAGNLGRIVLDGLYRRPGAKRRTDGTGFAILTLRNRRLTPPIFFRPPPLLRRKDPTMPAPFVSKLAAFLRSEDGPTAVEYAVMLALIVVACVSTITTLGSSASSSFSNVALNAAVSSGS
jgi:pilus assembly protein Flp/PilA